MSGKVPALVNVRVRLWLQPITAPARLRGQLASCLAWPPKTPLGKRPPSTFHGILGDYDLHTAMCGVSEVDVDVRVYEPPGQPAEGAGAILDGDH